MAAHLLSTGSRADIYSTLFNDPDPQGQSGVQTAVDCHRCGRVVLGVVETQLVVPEETSTSDEEGRVAYREPDIGKKVRLRELEGVEIVGDSIVGRVLQVCNWSSSGRGVV
jgi:hypothetical protein